MTDGWDRRRFFTTALSLTGVGVAGCSSQNDGGSGSPGAETPTDTAKQTVVDTPRATATQTPTDTATETPTDTPTETATETPTETATEAPYSDIVGNTASELEGQSPQESYNAAIESVTGSYDLNFNIDTSQSYEDQVREAAIKGARKGFHAVNRDDSTDFPVSTHITAMAAVTENIEDFNFEDGDIAAPHRIYSVGQQPGLMLEYTDPETGEQHQDLLKPYGERTNRSQDLDTNWTTENDGFWNDHPSESHIIDASIYEDTFEIVHPDNAQNKEGAREQFSAVPYNSHQLDVGVMPDSWDAWYKAEEKITEGNAKDFFDDITKIANTSGIENFAFGYDEDMDEFTVEEVYEDGEYAQMNPFQNLEWPREEETATTVS
mgnify:FL=1